MVVSLVHTRLDLDYGCCTLAILPANSISRRRLQSVLNSAARLQVFSSPKHHRVSPLLQRLHWLKMEQRIEYKLALLAYRCLHGLADWHHHTSPTNCSLFPLLTHGVTDGDDCDQQVATALVVPPTRLSNVGDRAFPVAAARVWNSLPVSVTSAAIAAENRTSFAAMICRLLMHANILYNSVYTAAQLVFFFLVKCPRTVSLHLMPLQ